MLASIRALVFYTGYVISLVIYASFCILAGLFFPLKTRYVICLQWNRFAIWWLTFTCNVRYHISGLENIPARPFVILSNHQSPWETIFFVLFFQPVCPILKFELLRIPFFGWGLKLLNPIAIDRNKRKEARTALLTQGQARIRDGFSVLVFPEGTRVDPGQDKKFSSGGAELAIAAQTWVLPIAHNAGVYWPAHKMIKKPGTIAVHIGPAIDASNRDPRELTEEVSLWVKAALQNM